MDGGAKGREGERASTGCVACARRIFGTRVTSPARVATAHTQSVSQSVAVTEPHMHMPDAPSPTDMDSFRDRGNCIEHSKMRAKRARIT